MPVKPSDASRSEEHTSELQSRVELVCRLLLEKKKGRRLGGVISGKEGRRDVAAGWMAVAHHDRTARGEPGGAVLHIFFFNATATTEIYTLSLHDALPI